MKRISIFTFLLMILSIGTPAFGQRLTNKPALLKFSKEKETEFYQKKAEAEEYARLNNIPMIIETDSTYMELMFISDFGMPMYYTITNANSAKTISTDKVHPGGGSGLILDGTGLTVHEWDAGAVLSTHQEFGSRVTQGDWVTLTHYHSTHVAGTMIASGVDVNAKGMAPNASLIAFDWNNDAGEMASEAASGAIVSNHSYSYVIGWHSGTWYGTPSISEQEDYLFGFYDAQARDWDQIAYDAPDYLIVKSAGNDRDECGNGYPCDGPYDCIGHCGISKNVLTVGAVYDINSGYSQPSDVHMTTFSSWGPADDGRVKPDLVASGYTLYSTDDDSDNDYSTLSGTSMSAPSVAGSLILLQQHYKDLFGSDKTLKAATLKALAIHTADEAGTSDGPDYQFGWGLMNTLHAAEKITEEQTTDVILEHMLTDGESYTREIITTGSDPIRVTLVWTDPPGTPPAPSLDPPDVMLVNDLDLQLEDVAGSSIYYPWKLDRDNPSNAATNLAENNVDNIEVIDITSPTNNTTYTITVDYDGTLTNGSQAFSMIISGDIETEIAPVADFYTDKTTPGVNEGIFLHDASANIPNSWTWTFNPASVTFLNGTDANSQNPQVKFTSMGMYEVSLYVENAYGNDTKTKTAYIDVICGSPKDLTAINIQSTSAELYWIDYNSAWEIMLDTAGFDTTGITPVSITSKPYTWFSLTAETEYDWYIKADCGSGECSDWVGPGTFTTHSCDISPVTLPFTEDWESQTGTRQTDGCIYCNPTCRWNFETDRQGGGRVMWGTDAYLAHSGNGALTMDRNPSGAVAINYSILTLDMTNYASSIDLELSFWWTDHRDEESGHDKVWVRGTDTCAWLVIYDLDPWLAGDGNYQKVSGLDIDALLAAASPPQTVSATFQLRFGQEDNYFVGADGLSFDDITIQEVTCPFPVNQITSNITSTGADLRWTERGDATAWQLMLGPAGFDTATATPFTITKNHYAWTGLNEFTMYEWYIRADCGGGDHSEWTGPMTFSSYFVLWEKCYGGWYWELPHSIQQTFDSGYIVTGSAFSIDGDVHQNHGGHDFWIVKLKNNGDTIWTKTLGGSGTDWAYSIQQTYDSGYVVTGLTTSNNIDVHGNHGAQDMWVVKLNRTGDTIWTKCLGGSGEERPYTIQQTYDSGYVVAGYTESNDGDVEGNHGDIDMWVVKLNNSGDILWTKTLGGSRRDECHSIQQTYDSGFILAGKTSSVDGDVHGNHYNLFDFWIVKLNVNGDTLWTKCLGGSNNDAAYSIQQTYDSGYIVVGYANSKDGDVHGHHHSNNYSSDFWIVKLNQVGDTIWTRCLGGMDDGDVAQSVQQTFDSGFIITGYANSDDYDVHANHGMHDFWVVKLNNNGETLWTKTLGGKNDDKAYSIQQTFDSGYIIAGETFSNDGDVQGNHSTNSDFWVVKLGGFLNSVSQVIPLFNGWNILSFNVTPNDSNMLHIVQPLIDSSELIKVLDEAGGFIQNIPSIGWMNTIGNMANTEGYYTKVNTNTQLQTAGLPVVLPFTIPLATGWNIMGYPLQQSQDALTAVQSLIDDDELIKILDESGGFIQDIPGIGWMNTIGDFETGEGYYIKVTDNTSLTLDNPPVLFIGSPPIVQKQPQLFGVPKANPYLPMNIIVTGIDIEGYSIQDGDETAVFDNNRLVGAGVITTGNKAFTSFATTMDDPTTTEIDGYIEGNIPGFQFRSTNLTGSIQLTAKPVLGDLRFSPLGTLVCTLEGSLTAVEQKKEKTFALKCVPNPANNYTNIQYQLPEEGQLQLEVYDLSSHRIATLQNEQQSAGNYHYRFDAALLERGIYLVKIQLRTKDNQYTEVVKFVKN